jgi:hypothetical protein
MSPKELEQYLKVCRRHGVTYLCIDGVSVTLDLAHAPSRTTPTPQVSEPSDSPTPELSEEDILNWSAGAPL